MNDDDQGVTDDEGSSKLVRGRCVLFVSASCDMRGVTELQPKKSLHSAAGRSVSAGSTPRLESAEAKRQIRDISVPFFLNFKSSQKKKS